ncbi:hypothetical protein TWF225_010116 [Orbilia oligospora]|nr:hypothetical protein TWF225_010116 [Orbilia oligospora]KAF3241341.1 hypothetical protein TWF128_011055 [Orbilia oligospora]KAF3244298.1 hypothetical protein TWF217_010799 [Orbilia oligospora]
MSSSSGLAKIRLRNAQNKKYAHLYFDYPLVLLPIIIIIIVTIHVFLLHVSDSGSHLLVFVFMVDLPVDVTLAISRFKISRFKISRFKISSLPKDLLSTGHTPSTHPFCFVC